MENRKRNIQMKFYVTEEEKRLIDEKMKQLPIPRWLIDELFPNEPEENYMMHCPECDHKMIVKK